MKISKLAKWPVKKYGNSVNNIGMSSTVKKSHVLLLPYGMYCDYNKFLKKSYAHLADKPKFILFIAPSYNYCTNELIALTNYEFARIEEFSNFDRHFLPKLSLKHNIERESLEFERIEILFPHINYVRENLPEFKSFPIFYNNIEEGTIKSILEEFWGECSFVFLTSMSIGLNYNDAKRADEFHAKELENNRANDLTHMDFSAFKILPELMEFNKANNYQFRRIDLQNSGDISNNLSSTTGYGAWYLDEHVK